MGPLGGIAVTITGTGFVPGQTAVTVTPSVGPPIDVAAADVTVVGPDSATFTVPPSAVAGAAAVSATTPGGTSSPVAFTYLPAPTATALTPSDGPVAGGTTVTVSGAGL